MSFWQRLQQRWAAWRQRRRAAYNRLPQGETGKAAAASGETAACLEPAAKVVPPAPALFTPFAVPAAQQQQEGAPSSYGMEARGTTGGQATNSALLLGRRHSDSASSLRGGGGASPRAVKLLLPHGSLVKDAAGAGDSPEALEVLEEEASGEVGRAQGARDSSSAFADRAAPAEQLGSSGIAHEQQGFPANEYAAVSSGECGLLAAGAGAQGVGGMGGEEEGTSGSSGGSSALDWDECISTADVECGRLDSVQSAMLRLDSVRSAQRPDQAQAPAAPTPPGPALREPSILPVCSSGASMADHLHHGAMRGSTIMAFDNSTCLSLLIVKSSVRPGR